MSLPTPYKNGTSIRSAVEVISSEHALGYLKQNGVNRPFKRYLAERYADTMRRGGWLLNGESLIFSESGRLLDGQHRLHAVVMTGQPVEMLVVRGVQREDEAFDTLNSGVRRSLADRLGGRGEKYHALLAASLTWLHRYQHGVNTMKATRPLEPDVMAGLLQEHGAIREWLSQGEKLKGQARFSPAIMVFVLYGASRQYPLEAERFYEQCLDGVNLTKTDSTYLLRQRVMQQSLLTRLNPVVLLALTIKAWNAHVEHLSMGNLKYAPGVEEFPELVGFAPSQV